MYIITLLNGTIWVEIRKVTDGQSKGPVGNHDWHEARVNEGGIQISVPWGQQLKLLDMCFQSCRSSGEPEYAGHPGICWTQPMARSTALHHTGVQWYRGLPTDSCTTLVYSTLICNIKTATNSIFYVCMCVCVCMCGCVFVAWSCPTYIFSHKL